MPKHCNAIPARNLFIPRGLFLAFFFFFSAPDSPQGTSDVLGAEAPSKVPITPGRFARDVPRPFYGTR